MPGTHDVGRRWNSLVSLELYALESAKLFELNGKGILEFASKCSGETSRVLGTGKRKALSFQTNSRIVELRRHSLN